MPGVMRGGVERQRRSRIDHRYYMTESERALIFSAQGGDRFVPKCMARPCVARRRSKIDERESCKNVLGL
jgi:hypothetical protein